MKPKLLIIAGPTAVGKTELGIELAKKYDGEIVSADSRQVYKGMDIGTGKDIEDSSKFKSQNARLNFKHESIEIGYREKAGIPIWLVDIVDPDYLFNVSDYRFAAKSVLADIHARGKLPIVVGGTGLYIRSLIEPYDLLDIPRNGLLRKDLEMLDTSALQEKLQSQDQKRFMQMNHSDQHNPRRLVRAIEIAIYLKNHPYTDADMMPDLNVKIIGLRTSLQILETRISLRVQERMRLGLLHEVQSLVVKGYPWQLPSMSATGYRVWESYFKKESTLAQVERELIRAEVAYAKRQLTWFKKMSAIEWFDSTSERLSDQILSALHTWYTEKKHP